MWLWLLKIRDWKQLKRALTSLTQFLASSVEHALACKLEDHQTVLQSDEEYRRRFAFCEFYLGLMQKNFGSLKQSQIHLKKSLELHTPQ
jgi:hypothetical protein